jgi:hypothetical protein
MAGIDQTVWCDGCGVEITWGPVVAGKRKYCCQDCAAGLECDCGVRMEIADDAPGSQPAPADTSRG